MTELTDWLLEQGRDSDDLGAIFKEFSERLLAAGIPVCRTNLGMPTLDPTAAVITFVWSRDQGLTSAALSPEEAYGPSYQQSPIRYLLDRNQLKARWNLADPDVVRRFPLFEQLRAEGITEYALRFEPFSRRRTALQGAALSMATDRPGGFTDAEVAAVERDLPALSVVAYRIALSRVAVEILDAYLGPQTGAQVLQGRIRRGDSQVMSAALLLADLRGFTALVDRASGGAVVGWLNEHLECIGDAVVAHGGEVLKFLGDGALAVFPSDRVGAGRACRDAVNAAIDARSRNADLNARRAADGGPTLDLTVALHFGEVVYGNIGTARRLDFTVVGPAVNEVSRMEALGKALGHDLLLSQTLAGQCGRPVRSLGPHDLRGVAGAREMYVIAS